MPSISFLLAKKQLIKKFRASNWNYKTSQQVKSMNIFNQSRSTLVETKYSLPVMVLAKQNIK
jgi:hypothetical protein